MPDTYLVLIKSAEPKTKCALYSHTDLSLRFSQEGIRLLESIGLIEAHLLHGKR